MSTAQNNCVKNIYIHSNAYPLTFINIFVLFLWKKRLKVKENNIQKNCSKPFILIHKFWFFALTLFFSYQPAFWMSIALGRIVLDLSSYNNNNKTSHVSLHLFFLQEVYVFNSMVFYSVLYNVCIREVFVWAITGVKHIFFCIQFNLHLKCIPLSLFLCSVPKKIIFIILFRESWEIVLGYQNRVNVSQFFSKLYVFW